MEQKVSDVKDSLTYKSDFTVLTVENSTHEETVLSYQFESTYPPSQQEESGERNLRSSYTQGITEVLSEQQENSSVSNVFGNALHQSSGLEVHEEDLGDTLTESRLRVAFKNEDTKEGKDEHFSGEELAGEDEETCSVEEISEEEACTERDEEEVDTEGEEEEAGTEVEDEEQFESEQEVRLEEEIEENVEVIEENVEENGLEEEEKFEHELRENIEEEEWEQFEHSGGQIDHSEPVR